MQRNLAQFIEPDELSGEEGEWVMMTVFVIGSLLEFDEPDGVIQRACRLETSVSSAPWVAGAPSISYLTANRRLSEWLIARKGYCPNYSIDT